MPPSILKPIIFCTFFILVFSCIKILSSNANNFLTTKSGHCSNIDLKEDQCTFVKNTCHGFSAIYLEFYYCSTLWKPVIIIILLSVLFLLFGAISVVASDFFCPNLQTIASKLELSESLAGVTVLAFGNGSPDLFGTFSAMDSGSGSMAIGEIIGAAFFIVSVITGCMGIIRPFQSKRITFMRDASFLTGAVALVTWIIYHGKIYWYHGLALIGYYIAYVVTVLLSSYNWSDELQKEMVSKLANQNILDETSRLLGSQGNSPIKPPRLNIPDQGFSCSTSEYEPHLGHIIRPMSPLSSKVSKMSLRIDTSVQHQQQHQRHGQLPRTASTNGSISTIRPYRRAMTPRVGIRTSLFGAIEFTSQISAIRRTTSSQQMIPGTPTLIVPGSDDQQRRRRQVSVPQEFWQRPPHPSFNSMQFGRSPRGRQRASTITTEPPVITHNSSLSATLPRPTTPDSSHSSTGVAEDYFAYLSTHQPQPMQPLTINTTDLSSSRLSVPAPPSSHQYLHPPSLAIGQQHTSELTIPEIRLAPPMVEQYHTPLGSAVSPEGNDHHRLPSPQHHQQQRDNGSLNVITPSPSVISTTTTDYDCFVSARQSPELTPASFEHECQALSIPTSSLTGDRHIGDDDEEINQKLQTASYISNLNNNNSNNNNNSLYTTLVQVHQVLFPTLQEWKSKSLFSCFSSLVAMPLVLIFTVTLPVAEAEDVKVEEVEVLMHDDDDDDYMYHTGTTGPHPPFESTNYNNNNNIPPSSYTSPTASYGVITQGIPSSVHTTADDRLLPKMTDPPSMTSPFPKSSSSYLAVPTSESDYLLGQSHHHHHHQQQHSGHDHHSAASTSDIMDITDADLQQGWCRWLLAVQCVFSTTFVFCILALNKFLSTQHIPIGIGIGLSLSLVVLATTKTDEPPKWFWMLSFAGFVISLNWIFLLADTMVGLLQALGKIFDISEAIMGLTVFAFGNSVGDLVSNTAIAKMGFPTMAISACYAGPLLNMVLGVGVSSTYQIWKARGQPYSLAIPPTIFVSSAGLLTVLLSTLFVVNMNGFHVNKQLGYWTISVYTFCCITNLLLEFSGFKL
ncbi:Sodium/calcium exchanger protein-domain-containing protein [Halteromyces radiatus]|uniref:Sodium/calcium exchanger protein-domain-containing protein n=1 Tax=Halteromyces radiatus TaxID=101107 RepID=UPI00221F92D0|nr:Sodium/calcium exchanger protein-domain-containing protein [Halteromyces radiatus]KAI8089294.1 Sodium/calcium exchanger protein-domain-containing protein [Halteromyces radiatus]